MRVAAVTAEEVTAEARVVTVRVVVTAEATVVVAGGGESGGGSDLQGRRPLRLASVLDDRVGVCPAHLVRVRVRVRPRVRIRVTIGSVIALRTPSPGGRSGKASARPSAVPLGSAGHSEPGRPCAHTAHGQRLGTRLLGQRFGEFRRKEARRGCERRATHASSFSIACRKNICATRQQPLVSS